MGLPPLLLANRGALNAALRWIGATDAPLALLYGNGSVLLGVVYTVLLTMLLPLFTAFDRLPSDVLDVATDLGAGMWRRQLFVVLPLGGHRHRIRCRSDVPAVSGRAGGARAARRRRHANLRNGDRRFLRRGQRALADGCGVQPGAVGGRHRRGAGGLALAVRALSGTAAMRTRLGA